GEYLIDLLALRRALDQCDKALQPGFFSFRAYDPPGRGTSIPGGLGMEPLPGPLIVAKQPLMRLVKLGGVPLLVRVAGGLFLGALLKRLQAGWAHPSEAGKFGNPADVHRTPDTAWFPRRKADRIT